MLLYYFAYGSNLWLDQMARRCPTSYYIGRGCLMDYKWQINERGFANVIPCAGSCVHGLVYGIGSLDDLQRLDASEGVAMGAYSKAYLDVVLYRAGQQGQPVPPLLTVDVRDMIRGHDGSIDRPPPHEDGPMILPQVLVYLSTRYTTPGAPRPEYIERINRGIRHAILLGVPEAYFANVVRADIPA